MIGSSWRGAALGLTLVLLAGCASGSSGAATDPVALGPADAKANDAMYNCLIDQGFPVTRGASGGVDFVDPNDDRFSDYQAAYTGCRQQLVDQGLLKADSIEDLRNEFALATALHDCLTAADFPLTPLPSEQVYIEQHDAVNILNATSPVELDDVRTACPDEFRALENR